MMDYGSAKEKLRRFLDDPDISEIMINGPRKVFVEKGGKKSLTDVTFASDEEILGMIADLYTVRGKRIDKDVPYADVCLEDGTRINTIISPISRFGVSVTIRKFAKGIDAPEDLIRLGTLNKKALDFIIACIKGKVNILFSGGTGVGKTTALQVLSQHFAPQERVIVVEDAAELQLEQTNVISLETRTPDRDGKGGVSLRDLIRNALRMTPDRLVVGEVRGVESIDLIQAMATGHTGTIGIVHGNSPREVISRLETMVMMAGFNLPLAEVRKIIGSTVQIVVHMERMRDGTRKVTYVTEIRGVEHEQIAFNDLFVYRFDKKDEYGKDVYDLMPAIRNFPVFFKRLEKAGLITNAVFSRE
ncbi:MAG: CpaF family protein [Candidatus Omnitrophica bacterium]|nr:CpaF family protein [Candidatus Omnitrophota bacterium]